MLVVAAGGDAFAVALDLAFGAGAPRRDAGAARADTAGARVAAGAAVGRVGGQIAAAVDRAAVFDTDRAARPDALAATALHRDEAALADGSAGSAVVQIRLHIDAVAQGPALGETRLAGG